MSRAKLESLQELIQMIEAVLANRVTVGGFADEFFRKYQRASEEVTWGGQLYEGLNSVAMHAESYKLGEPRTSRFR